MLMYVCSELKGIRSILFKHVPTDNAVDTHEYRLEAVYHFSPVTQANIVNFLHMVNWLATASYYLVCVQEKTRKVSIDNP